MARRMTGSERRSRTVERIHLIGFLVILLLAPVILLRAVSAHPATLDSASDTAVVAMHASVPGAGQDTGPPGL